MSLNTLPMSSYSKLHQRILNSKLKSKAAAKSRLSTRHRSRDPTHHDSKKRKLTPTNDDNDDTNDIDVAMSDLNVHEDHAVSTKESIRIKFENQMKEIQHKVEQFCKTVNRLKFGNTVTEYQQFAQMMKSELDMYGMVY